MYKRQLIDLDPQELGGEEVSSLVDRDEQAEEEDADDDIDKQIVHLRDRLAPWGALWFFLGAVGTAGTWPSRAGPHFSGEMGERAPGAVPLDPAGERVSFPHTPFLWTVVEAAWFFDRPTWPAAVSYTHLDVYKRQSGEVGS